MDIDAEALSSANDEQLSYRVQHGDDLAAYRAVDHTAIFRRKKDARAAAAELLDAGYATRTGGRFRKRILEASKLERLDGANPLRFVTEVATIVLTHGGAYDGWGGLQCGPSSGERAATGDPIVAARLNSLTTEPSLYIIEYASGLQFAGLSRNPRERLRVQALLFPSRGAIASVRVSSLDGEKFARRRDLLQQTLFMLNDGKLLPG